MSSRRVLLLTVLSLLATASAAAGTEPVFTSSPFSRYGGDNPSAGLEDAAGSRLSAPLSQVARIPVRIRPSRAVCEAKRVRWWLDGVLLQTHPDPRAQPRGSCAWTLSVDEEGGHRLAVDIGTGRRQQMIRADDRLVVVLGDSVAAGEGNPRPVSTSGKRDRVWLERACHRSATSGFEGAARRVARRSEQTTSITFVNLACSGATVPTGILGPYRGIEPPKGSNASLGPQIERLNRLVSQRGRIDAVMISVGANDVRFGGVVALCARSRNCAQRPLGGRPASEEVPRLIAGLTGRYARLGRALRKVPHLREVLLTEYFNTTRGSSGQYCERSVGFARRNDLRWAEQSLLLPLNDAGRAAARRHRWTYVDGIRRRFTNHGYCAGTARWVVAVSESLLKNTGSPIVSRTKGTLHPNGAGHQAIAEAIAPRLAARLDLPKPRAVARAATVPPADPDDESTSVLDGILYGLAALAAVGMLMPTALRVLRWAAYWLGVLGLVMVLLVGLVIEVLVLCAAVAVAAIPLVVWSLLPAPAKDFLRDLWRQTKHFWLVAWRRARGGARGLAGWARRVGLLLSPSGRSDPVRMLTPMQHVPTYDRTLTGLLATAIKALGGLLTGAGIVLLLGATILWVRFASVGVPAGQAVNAAGEKEWLVTGWHALILFALLAGFAVLLTRVLDEHATSRRPTRRALSVLLVLELLAGVVVGDFRMEQALQIGVGFAVAAFLLHLLADHAIPVGRELRTSELKNLPERLWRSLVGDPQTKRRRWQMTWRLAALVPLGGALLAAAIANESDRPLFIAPALLLAAILFTAPGGLAEHAHADSRDRIEGPRVLLAGTILACLAILLGRDESWLFGATVAAVVLAAGCLFVAATTGRRFAPYAIAVMLSVPLYGAVLHSLRAVDRPSLQPFAAITADGRDVCGVYVGRTDGRVWYGALELKEDVPSNRTERLRGRLASVPDADRVAIRVAPLQSLDAAQARAVALRDELLAERERDRGGPTCTTAASEPESQTRHEADQRRLADALAPELLVARDDGFPPVSVQTMFALRDRRQQLCRRVDPDHCLRITHQGQLPWSGGEGQYLNYPAKARSKEAQRAALLGTLGTADPERSAATYYLVAGRRGHPLSVQHWFFYPYNYQRVDVRPGKIVGGFHEGDFESVGVLTSKSRRPRYVWMARHDSEGRVFGWNETALQTEGDHVRVYVARGSHASYERCGRHVRPVGRGRVDDRAACSQQDPLRFDPTATRRIDLARTGWACWHGRFGQSGETVIDRLPQVVNRGPFSPLWQQSFRGERSTPCAGVADPGNRQGPAEEVADAQTAARLRARAGELTPLIDDCSDWERPQLEGVYIVVCDDKTLDDYVASGFEASAGGEVRIARPDDPRPRSKMPDIPAVQRDHDALRPAPWRITARRLTRATVFVSCRQGSRVLDGRFEDVRLVPGRRYRIDDRGPEVWRLLSGDRIDAQAKPTSGGEPAGATVDCSAQPPGGG